jgi:hypothetical protein
LGGKEGLVRKPIEKKRQANREKARPTALESAEIQKNLSMPSMDVPLRQLQPQQVLDLQRQVGNQALQRTMAREAGMGRVMRAVEYNPQAEGGRQIDPEQARGTLPFTDEGWDARAIGRNLSQLYPTAPRSAEVRCVQTSFLVALVQRGPGAVNEMIANYLRRYRTGLRQASTPANIRRWYQRSIRNLSPIPGRIDGQTATYNDLSTLLREMYDVYGSAPGGTGLRVEANMMRREGYTAQILRLGNVTQAQAAAQAATLRPGEFLSCAVNASRLGTGPYNHEIQIGAYPDGGGLYLYDPWPVVGNQLIGLDSGLNAMRHYFVNEPGDTATTSSGEVMVFDESEVTAITAEATEASEVAPGAEGETAEETAAPAEEAAAESTGAATEGSPTPRTFGIRAKYSPPAPAEAEEAEG